MADTFRSNQELRDTIEVLVQQGRDLWWHDLVESKPTECEDYTAPPLIRSFIKAGPDWPQRHDLPPLRPLGTVGEPINPEAWVW